MTKAVFFDLDGTLLDSRKRIPDSAKEAISRCRGQGVRTYIVTARSPRLHQTLGWTEDDYALFDGAIHSNGAVIRQGETLRYCYIHPVAVRHCLREAAACAGVEMSLHMPQEYHAFTFAVDADRLARWHLTPDKVRPIDENVIRQTLKILIFHDDLTEDRPPLPAGLGPRLEACCAGLARILVTDEGRTIQAVPLEAGKLSAVEGVRRQLGLTVDEVAVFGDDLNDLEMIAHYPRSIAMGNAVEAIKAAAGYVTASNDEGGIARGLAWAMEQEGMGKERD